MKVINPVGTYIVIRLDHDIDEETQTILCEMYKEHYLPYYAILYRDGVGVDSMSAILATDSAGVVEELRYFDWPVDDVLIISEYN